MAAYLVYTQGHHPGVQDHRKSSVCDQSCEILPLICPAAFVVAVRRPVQASTASLTENTLLVCVQVPPGISDSVVHVHDICDSIWSRVI